MCFHPIKIRNPSLLINPEIDKPFIEVPCGHCPACVGNKVNDLVARAYYEWQNSVKNNGWTYFDTLTYSNDSVPRLHGEMIFSREDLTKFFKTLRIRLVRQGFQLYDEHKNNLLKYIVTTEYGDDDRFTHRPHYHILWFSSVPGLSILKFYQTVRSVWTYTYKFGWNDKISDVLNHVVNRLDGIRYVCKYIEKQQNYDKKLRDMLKLFKNDSEKTLDIYRNIKNIKPFYRASLGFGSSILDVPYSKLSSHGVPVMTSKGIEFYSLPLYIKRKIFFDKVNHPFEDDKTLLRRNSLGIDYLVSHLDEIIDSKTLFYKNIIDNADIFSDEVKQVKDFVYDLLGDRSLRDFVIYKSVYKGHLFSDFSFYDYHKYFDFWLRNPRSIRSPFKFKKQCEEYLCTENHSIITDKSKVEFFGFDDIDNALDFLVDCSNDIKEKQLIRKQHEKEKIDSIVKRFIPCY